MPYSSPAFSRNNDAVYQDAMRLFNQGFDNIYQKESKTYRSTTGFFKNFL